MTKAKSYLSSSENRACYCTFLKDVEPKLIGSKRDLASIAEIYAP
jgi:hypothetical protein